MIGQAPIDVFDSTLCVHAAARDVHRLERRAGVEALEHHRVGGLVQPEPQAVTPAAPRIVGARAHHLGDGRRGDDLTGEQRLPQRVHVGRGREDPAVADPAHREMEHVGAQPVVEQVADRGVTGQFVGAQVRGVGEPGRSQTWVRTRSWYGVPAARSASSGEHDVAPVAVGERRPWGELLREPVEDLQVVLARLQSVHGHGHHVVGDLAARRLVEVVADARAVAEEVLDRHPVVDQGQVGAEQGAGRGRQLERAELDQAHHHQRGEPLGPLATPIRVPMVLGTPWARSASP